MPKLSCMKNSFYFWRLGLGPLNRRTASHKANHAASSNGTILQRRHCFEKNAFRNPHCLLAVGRGHALDSALHDQFVARVVNSRASTGSTFREQAKAFGRGVKTCHT